MIVSVKAREKRGMGSFTSWEEAKNEGEGFEKQKAPSAEWWEGRLNAARLTFVSSAAFLPAGSSNVHNLSVSTRVDM